MEVNRIFIMQYLVTFEMGSAKNKCIFDRKEDAVVFSKHIKQLDGVGFVYIDSLLYEYELTTEVNDLK